MSLEQDPNSAETQAKRPHPAASEPGWSVVGLSGGAASAVAAALLHSQNRPLHAVWINLGGVSPEDPADPVSSGLATRCFDPAGRETSLKIAKLLGLEWHELDARDPAWHSIVDPYVHSRLGQRFYHPCVSCLSELRAPLLLEWARRHGCRTVVLGSRARVVSDRDTGKIEIRRAKDHSRDQSWRLGLLGRSPADLAMLELPLGELPEAMIARLLGILSEKLGSPIVPETNPIGLGSPACGSSLDSVKRVLSRRVPHSLSMGGVIRAPSGGLLGEHEGMGTWVFGQAISIEQQNLTLEPAANAVAGSIDGRAHIINAASANDWLSRDWIVDEAVWMGNFSPSLPQAVRLVFPRVPDLAEALSGRDGVPGRWVGLVEHRGRIQFDPPAGAAGWRGHPLIQGQPVLIYDETGDRLLGSARVFRKALDV